MVDKLEFVKFTRMTFKKINTCNRQVLTYEKYSEGKYSNFKNLVLTYLK